MQVNLFSVDLKLVEDGASYRVLEFNDGLRSGFTGYDSLGDRRMFSDVVTTDYESLFPDMRMVNLNGHGGGGGDMRRALLMPRGDRLVTGIGRADLVVAQRMEDVYQTLNGNLHFKALCENKAYQSHMANQMGRDDLFPRTQILPTDREEALAALETDTLSEHYMLKPLTFCGGTGIRLIEGANLEKDLGAYLKRRKWIWQKEEWPGRHDPACVLQERITANKVETERGMFDGTMRVAFTIYGEGSDLQCHIHDAYWKLPLYTMEEGEGSSSVISFSPSNTEKPKKRTIADLFRWVADDMVRAAPASADASVKLFPKLQDDLAKYFGFVAASDHLENTAALLNAEDSGRQTLGIMLATHPAFYPAVKADSLDMYYPQQLVEAIRNAPFAQSGLGHAFETLRRAAYTHGDLMHCEDGKEEFETPLRDVVESAAFSSSSLTNVMFQIMCRIK